MFPGMCLAYRIYKVVKRIRFYAELKNSYCQSHKFLDIWCEDYILRPHAELTRAEKNQVRVNSYTGKYQVHPILERYLWKNYTMPACCYSLLTDITIVPTDSIIIHVHLYTSILFVDNYTMLDGRNNLNDGLGAYSITSFT